MYLIPLVNGVVDHVGDLVDHGVVDNISDVDATHGSEGGEVSSLKADQGEEVTTLDEEDDKQDKSNKSKNTIGQLKWSRECSKEQGLQGTDGGDCSCDTSSGCSI